VWMVGTLGKPGFRAVRCREAVGVRKLEFSLCVLCIFVYYAWEITGMRSGSDERTSPVSPCLARSKRDLGMASETLAWLASPAKI
jgi:hypothetical protein